VAVYSHGIFFSFHFLSLELLSKTMDNCPSQAFLHGQFLYRIPAPSLLLLSIGCCDVLANGGCLKLMPYPSLYFFVTLFAASNDSGSDGLVMVTAGADAIVVETVDAEVHRRRMDAMVKILPLWLVGMRMEEGLLQIKLYLSFV